MTAQYENPDAIESFPLVVYLVLSDVDPITGQATPRGRGRARSPDILRLDGSDGRHQHPARPKCIRTARVRTVTASA